MGLTSIEWGRETAKITHKFANIGRGKSRKIAKNAFNVHFTPIGFGRFWPRSPPVGGPRHAWRRRRRRGAVGATGVLQRRHCGAVGAIVARGQAAARAVMGSVCVSYQGFPAAFLAGGRASPGGVGGGISSRTVSKTCRILRQGLCVEFSWISSATCATIGIMARHRSRIWQGCPPQLGRVEFVVPLGPHRGDGLGPVPLVRPARVPPV